jgi:hypothetical protein
MGGTIKSAAKNVAKSYGSAKTAEILTGTFVNAQQIGGESALASAADLSVPGAYEVNTVYNFTKNAGVASAIVSADTFAERSAIAAVAGTSAAGGAVAGMATASVMENEFFFQAPEHQETMKLVDASNPFDSDGDKSKQGIRIRREDLLKYVDYCEDAYSDEPIQGTEMVRNQEAVARVHYTPTELVIAFRGTYNTATKVIGATLQPIRLDDFTICHLGFYQYVDKIFNQLLEIQQQNQDKNLVVVGHSLGGISSLIFAYRLLEEYGIRVSKLFQLGAPMGIFASDLNYINQNFDIINVAHVHDPIPFHAIHFEHYGTKILLRQGGGYEVYSGDFPHFSINHQQNLAYANSISANIRTANTTSEITSTAIGLADPQVQQQILSSLLAHTGHMWDKGGGTAHSIANYRTSIEALAPELEESAESESSIKEDIFVHGEKLEKVHENLYVGKDTGKHHILHNTTEDEHHFRTVHDEIYGFMFFASKDMEHAQAGQIIAF